MALHFYGLRCAKALRQFEAQAYPTIMLVVGSLVLLFLLFYVVPRFAQVYDDISTPLPIFSRLLLALSHWLQGNPYFVLVGIAAIVGSVGYGWSQQALRSRMVERLWRIPALGAWMKVYQLGRLYRTLGMLLRSGIPALRSLDMVSGLLPSHLRPQLARAMTLLGEGAPMSFALTSVGLATPVATRMMSVGEKSGRMGELLDRIARFYDDMTARSVDAFTRIFEPLLMTALGLAVGLIVILMYMPIFELAGSLQ